MNKIKRIRKIKGLKQGELAKTAGIGVWFGYPDVVFILMIACLGAIIYELITHLFSGRIKDLFYQRLLPYFHKVLLKFVAFRKGIDLSIPNEFSPLPFGPFLVLSCWLMWAGNLLIQYM